MDRDKCKECGFIKGHANKCDLKPYNILQGLVGLFLMCFVGVPLIGWILGFVGCCMTFKQ